MARRKISDTLPISLDDIAKMVAEQTIMAGADSTTVVKVAEALETTTAVVMTVLNETDPDENVITGDRGDLWLTDTDDESGPSEPVPPAPKPTTPAERFKARKTAVQPAVTPVLDNQGSPITVPVNENDPNAGRRELDASQGERVISEESVTALVKEISNRNESESTMNENTTQTVSGSWINEGGESHFVDYVKGEAVTGHTLLPEPEFIPAPPEGVHPNVWELAQTGATLPARIYWGKIVRQQMDAYAEALKAAELAKAEETPAPAVEWTAPIDPITGQPFPF